MTPKENLLLIFFPSTRGLPASDLVRFVSSVRDRWNIYLVVDGNWAGKDLQFRVFRENQKTLPERIKKLLTDTPFRALLFCGESTIRKHFLTIRQIAGQDQSTICLLGQSLSGGVLREKRLLAQTLPRADAIWAMHPTEFGPSLRVKVLPQTEDGLVRWVESALEQLSTDTKQKISYGRDEDLASIIIPAQGATDPLRRCLKSVRLYTPGPHEIILISNPKVKRSLDFARKEQRLRIIPTAEMFCSPGAINTGLRAALGHYYVVLDENSLVTPGWLERLVLTLKRDRTIGIAAPYTANAKKQLRATREDPTVFAARWVREHEGGKLDVLQTDGSCLAIRREVIESVGLFDERFADGGFEFADLCLRVRQAGYRIVVAEDICLFHGDRRGDSHQHDASFRQARQAFVQKWGLRTLEFLREKGGFTSGNEI